MTCGGGREALIEEGMQDSVIKNSQDLVVVGLMK